MLLCTVVFLDISNAFDRVHHDGLLFKLKQFGIIDNSLNLFANYLKNCSQDVSLCGITTVSIIVVWKAHGFHARGSVIAFKIAPPSRSSGSCNFKHSKQYKVRKISAWICTVK